MEIFGVAVDGQITADYKKAFMVCGTSCSREYVEYGEAVYQGREAPWGFAKDSTFCEACHYIYTKEHDKLVDYNKRKGLDLLGQPIKRNEGSVSIMRHENFSEYIRDLQNIYKRSAPERAQLKDKLEEARKKWTEDEATNRHDEYALARAKMDWMSAQKEYREKCQELQERTAGQIKAVEREFRDHINDFYSASGCRLDDATVRLLNSGINLTENEINDMIAKNTGNVTMLRLISDHCEKNGIDNRTARIYGTVARRNGADEMRAFAGVADMILKAVGTDERTADTWSTARGHFERLSNEQIAALDNLSVKPAAQGGDQE